MYDHLGMLIINYIVSVSIGDYSLYPSLLENLFFKMKSVKRMSASDPIYIWLQPKDSSVDCCLFMVKKTCSLHKAHHNSGSPAKGVNFGQ